MLFHSLPMESRKRLTHDVFHDVATHSGVVRDVTATDSWAQDGSTHGRLLANFKSLKTI